jgi:hypothetical protein
MTLAQIIHDYIKLRASHEGVAFALPVRFFRDALTIGARPIFGVEHDGKRILSDEQEPYPGFLAAYLATLPPGRLNSAP